MIGFYFAGRYSGDQNCWWVPGRTEWFGTEDFETFTEESSSAPGGYYFGNRAKIRTISMKCFIEDITSAQLREIYNWLDKDASGELITEDRPMVAYDVRISKRVVVTQYFQHALNADNAQISGTFTLDFIAVNPYARLLATAYSDESSGWTLEERNMLSVDMMPPEPTVDDAAFLVFNPGDVPVPMNIKMNGTCTQNIVFRNSVNGTSCVLTGLEANALLAGEYLQVSGEDVTTYVRGGAAQRNGCVYHDKGYIVLEPNKILRSVEVTTTAGSSQVVGSFGAFDAGMVGAFIWMDGEWKRILSVADMEHITIAGACAATGRKRTKIVTMNQITIAGDGAFSLTSLEIDYTPRVR